MILLNPGPVTLTDRVRAALGAGDWCHREPEFASLMQDINTRLAGVYGELASGYRAVTIAASGSGAIEAMLGSLAPDEGITLVVANGSYGERMARMLAAHRKPHEVASHSWTAAPDVIAIEARLAREPRITHLAVVHHETTTGRLNDLVAIGSLCRRHGAVMLLDAVSSFGAEHIAGAGWNLGALAATANKCLHGAPGLSFVLARNDLWEHRVARAGSIYLDLHAYHDAQHRDGFSPFTMPVQVAFALREALLEHEDQGGVEARLRTYRVRAAAVHAALAGAGVATLLNPADYSSVLRSYRLPAGRSYAELHDALKEQGYVIYAGQGALAREIFRVAFMGDIRPAELERLCELLARHCAPRP
jgi:2-aminoethylphosphonate-pyruvate transaminase